MNINLHSEQPHPASSSARLGGRLTNVFLAASVAAAMGLAAITAGCAGPAARHTDASVAMSNGDGVRRAADCHWYIRGKYTAWQCDHRSAKTNDKAVARTP